jgi:hypothetical protein
VQFFNINFQLPKVSLRSRHRLVKLIKLSEAVLHGPDIQELRAQPVIGDLEWVVGRDEALALYRHLGVGLADVIDLDLCLKFEQIRVNLFVRVNQRRVSLNHLLESHFLGLELLPDIPQELLEVEQAA